MRKSGIKVVVLATALAMAVTATTATTVTAKKKAKKTVVKLVSLDTAARKYVNKANASANKKKGTTSLTVSVKGSVSEGKLRNAVSKIRCKNVKKITATVFKSEILCPNWSKLSVKDSGKYTTFKVKFNNKKMHNFSSYGKVNYFEEVEKKIYKNLAVFQKDFGKETMSKKSQLGAFAVAYCAVGGGCNQGGDGGATSSKYKAYNLDVCAKGLVGKSAKSTMCQGVSCGIVRVMRILGFKEDECGVTFDDSHMWNWWKDGDQVYFGDGQDGGIDFVDAKNKVLNPSDEEVYRGFASDLNNYNDGSEDESRCDFGWGSFLTKEGKGNFDLPAGKAWEYLGFESRKAYNEKLKELQDRVYFYGDKEADKALDALFPEQLTFEEFNKYYPIKGFWACPIEQEKKWVKKNDPLFGASDGKKGTNWKLHVAKFTADGIAVFYTKTVKYKFH